MAAHEHHSTFGPIITQAVKDIEATPGRLVGDAETVVNDITSELTIRHDHADAHIPHHHLSFDGASAPIPVMPAPVGPVAPAPVPPAPTAPEAVSPARAMYLPNQVDGSGTPITDEYGRLIPRQPRSAGLWEAGTPAPAPTPAPSPKPAKTAGLWDF
jgi:hypothetical protein